jgi:hypothetical protein
LILIVGIVICDLKLHRRGARWVDLCGQHRPGFTPSLKGAPDDDGLGLPKLLKSHYWNPFSLAPVQGWGKTEKMNENNWTIF